MRTRFWPPCLALLAFACAPAPQDLVSKGKAYYQASNCRACHRIGAEGAAGGPDLTLVGMRQDQAWLDLWLKDPAAWRPQTTMANPGLSAPARQAIVAYLASLKGQDWSKKPWEDAPASAARGKLIYQHAGCASCHGPNGAGGNPNNNVPGGKIPALDSVSQTFTKEELKNKVRLGARPQKADPAGPEPLVAMPAWKALLTEDELGDVVEYLFTLRSAKPDAGW